MQEEESIVRMAYDAFLRKDRTLMESLISDDFEFTSPFDDHIHRNEFFERCWPGSQKIQDIHIMSVAVSEEEVLVHYEVNMKDGSHFKNVDTFVIKDDMIMSQDVYFGDPPKGMSRDDFAHLGTASSGL